MSMMLLMSEVENATDCAGRARVMRAVTLRLKTKNGRIGFETDFSGKE